MVEKLQVYKCEDSGLLVEVLEGADCELACCGKPMVLLEEQTADASAEKHVPYIEKTADGVKVSIGQNAAHPMADDHYIQWIELLVDGKAYRQFLKPGDAPEAVFCVAGDRIGAREHCNVHGLWKG